MMKAARAYATIHDGAVYLHLGRSYRVLELDLAGRRAMLAVRSARRQRGRPDSLQPLRPGQAPAADAKLTALSAEKGRREDDG